MKLPQELHPEFGYLHLSSETRRTMRVALAAAAFGIVVGAGATLGMTGSRGAPAGQVEQAMTVGSSDRSAGLGAISSAAAHPAAPHILGPRKWRSGHPLATMTAATSAPALAAPPARTVTASAPAVAPLVTAPATPSPAAQGTIQEAPAADTVDPGRRERRVHRKRHREYDSAFASPFGGYSYRYRSGL